jgi:hypothetical protein
MVAMGAAVRVSPILLLYVFLSKSFISHAPAARLWVVRVLSRVRQ